MTKLSEIERQLRDLKATPRKAKPRHKGGKGRKPSRSTSCAKAIADMASRHLNRTWDGPVPWGPIRRQLEADGWARDTILRARKAAGITLWPSRRARLAYPPGQEPGPDPVAAEPTPREADPAVPDPAAVELGVEALADGLGASVAEVAQAVTTSAESVAPEPYLSERLEHELGAVSGLRRSTRETLAGHKARTVADALGLEGWLDEVIGREQASRIRFYARGLT